MLVIYTLQHCKWASLVILNILMKWFCSWKRISCKNKLKGIILIILYFGYLTSKAKITPLSSFYHRIKQKMGGSESKLNFRQAVVQLTSKKTVSNMLIQSYFILFFLTHLQFTSCLITVNVRYRHMED